MSLKNGLTGLRLLFRILALLALAVAVISAVVDIARSLSASTFELTSLLKGWTAVSPSSLQMTQRFFQERLPHFLTDPVLNVLLNLPAVAVFAVLAVLFYAIGAKREKPFGQFGMH